jgi:hypothetical protein
MRLFFYVIPIHYVLNMDVELSVKRSYCGIFPALVASVAALCAYQASFGCHSYHFHALNEDTPNWTFGLWSYRVTTTPSSSLTSVSTSLPKLQGNTLAPTSNPAVAVVETHPTTIGTVGVSPTGTKTVIVKRVQGNRRTATQAPTLEPKITALKESKNCNAYPSDFVLDGPWKAARIGSILATIAGGILVVLLWFAPFLFPYEMVRWHALTLCVLILMPVLQSGTFLVWHSKVCDPNSHLDVARNGIQGYDGQCHWDRGSTLNVTAIVLWLVAGMFMVAYLRGHRYMSFKVQCTLALISEKDVWEQMSDHASVTTRGYGQKVSFKDKLSYEYI